MHPKYDEQGLPNAWKKANNYIFNPVSLFGDESNICSSSLLSFFLHKTSFKIVLGDIAREKAAVEKELSKGVRFSSLVL